MIRWSVVGALLAMSSLCSNLPQHEDVKESLFLRRIAEYWKEKDFTAAKSRIIAFLQEHPYSPYADHLKAMLGDLYLQEKDFLKAKAIYQGIESRQWQEKTLLSLIQALYELSENEEVLTTSQRFLDEELGTLEEKNRVRFIHAETYFRLGSQETGEKRDRLFRSAIDHYRVLKTTSYADAAWYPLAKMYTHLHLYPEAAEAYLALNALAPQDGENLLFHAALSQLQYDRKLAITTFSKIHPLKGRHAQEAAFYEIELLFQEKRYADLITTYHKVHKLLSKDRPLIDYYVGRSLFEEEDFSGAIPVLTRYLKNPDLSKVTLKNSLMALCVAAEKVGNLPLFTEHLKEIEAFFRGDPVVASLLILHADLAKKMGAQTERLLNLKTLISEYRDHPQREAILYDYAITLFDQKQWQEASSAFEQCLLEFPQSEKLGSIRRHQIFSLFEDLKQVPSGTETVKRHHLVATISRAMEEKAIFSKAEKKQIHYLLGKTLYDLHQFDEALTILSDFVEAYPKDAHAKQAHLLIAYCHKRGTGDPLLFVLHAEKALRERIPLSDPIPLHLQLYNAYLVLAQKERGNAKEKMIEQAAFHLFEARAQTTRDNLLWLAEFYEKKGDADPALIEKAILVFETLLKRDPNTFSATASIDPRELEIVTLRLNTLYEKAGRGSDQVTLLKTLEKEQTDHPDRPWKYQRKVVFELAQAYANLGKFDAAEELYDFLITTSSHTPSYFGPAAELAKLNLHYQRIDKGNISGIQEILDALKALEIGRRISSEPSHLEAALTYIAIKTSLAPEKEQIPVKRHLIEQMQEHFTAPQDPLVRQYLEAQEVYPEEKRLVDDYLAYLSAETHRLDALSSGSQELAEIARIELELLLTRSIHPSLKKWVDISREALLQSK